MTTYLATVTVTVVGDLSAEEAAGMSDALGASDHSVMPGRVVLHVPGEAPDLLTATAAAHRHAAFGGPLQEVHLPLVDDVFLLCGHDSARQRHGTKPAIDAIALLVTPLLLPPLSATGEGRQA